MFAGIQAMPMPGRTSPQPSVGEVDTFIDLLRLACDDGHVHATLMRLLAQDPPRRHALVHNWVSDLLISEAPRTFKQAIACLMDDAVAEQARAVILGRCRPSHPTTAAPQR
jgi:hypothetical protein